MKQAAIVGAGTAVGAVARYSLTLAFDGGLWILLFINILGSFIIGWAKPGPFWGTGVLGGFTSFAAFALLTSQQTAAMAGVYVLATVVGCVGAYLLGDMAARRKGRKS